MKILICGIDGYIGWPLALELLDAGHEVAGIDDYSRRYHVHNLNSQSVTPIATPAQREKVLKSHDDFYHLWCFDPARRAGELYSALVQFAPDAIVHLAEMPSAPWSMRSRHACRNTHITNVFSTLNLLWMMHELVPKAHLVKLGTMGEYGTPNVDIPEGHFELEFRGRKDYLPFPRQPGSWYHLTKVHDTHNIIFACRNWGLRSTDIMQGVVFGVTTPATEDNEELLTRFDCDSCFGTAINRFCAQAVVGHPLTVYGAGGQTRGWLPLCDSIQCLMLALANPPNPGEYRTFNQLQEVHSVRDLAEDVSDAAMTLDMLPQICNYENPRKEMEEHYYSPDCEALPALGYEPSDFQSEITKLLVNLRPYAERILREHLVPDIRWDGPKRMSTLL